MQEFIRKNLYNRTLLSFLLWPLSLIFKIIQVTRRRYYGKSSCSWQNPSAASIISVGNIVSGGTGKTPLTIFLARYLAGKNYMVAVSHRGYRGDFEHHNRLISNRTGLDPSAAKSGDEAYLLARNLKGIPVITGKDRKRSIEILNVKFPDLDYIILDDSFQHLKVKHDLDLVVFNAHGGIGNGFLLPAGILREPVSALDQADIIILNGSDIVPSYLEKYSNKVLTGKYGIRSFSDPEHKKIDSELIRKSRICLLSAIGQPDSLEKTLLYEGFSFIRHFKFRDHYNYSDRDLHRIGDIIKREKIDYLVTTEKDFSKLMEKNTGRIPLLVLEVEFIFSNPEQFEDKIRDLLIKPDFKPSL